MYNSVSTADIFNAVLDAEKEGEKAAAVLAMRAVAKASFIVLGF